MKARTEKIKVSETIIKEISISFPYCVEEGCVMIKFFDRKKGIMVADYPFSKQVQYMEMPDRWLGFKPTTEEKFNAKFKEVMNTLIDLNNEKII